MMGKAAIISSIVAAVLLAAPVLAQDAARPAAPPLVQADPAPTEDTTPAPEKTPENLAAPAPEAKPAPVAALPAPHKGFVHLASVDSTIVQDMRYAGPENFTGARVPGYEGPSCILAEPVAQALAKVQGDLKSEGLTLVMLDCYRPARSVKAMVAAMTARKGTNATYHPKVPASQLVKQGYLASRSGHSSGGSVDLSLARIGADGKTERLDMGSVFDFFDPLSHTAASKVSAKAHANRQTLVKAMQKRGFSNYSREWWHYRFTAEPFAGRHFDFPVVAAPETPKT